MMPNKMNRAYRKMFCCCFVFIDTSLIWWEQSFTGISDVYYRSCGCFTSYLISPHPVVPFLSTAALVSSLCTFAVGEACILFHSSPTFHMHLPLISTMVWNFTLKLKFLLSNSYLEKIYVLVVHLSQLEQMHRLRWETYLLVSLHAQTSVSLSLFSPAIF